MEVNVLRREMYLKGRLKYLPSLNSPVSHTSYPTSRVHTHTHTHTHTPTSLWQNCAIGRIFILNQHNCSMLIPSQLLLEGMEESFKFSGPWGLSLNPCEYLLLGKDFSSVQFSHSVMSDSLWPHGLQHARLPCPSPAPGTCSSSCAQSWWCHPIVSSSVDSFSSCLQSFPASGSLIMSQFFSSGGQSIGASASASVLPVRIQNWFPLGQLIYQGINVIGASQVGQW